MKKTKLFLRKIYVLVLILSAALLSACSAGPSDEAEKYVVLIGEDSEITEKLSDIDLLVIDAEYFSQNDIARLRENGIREIYSYINIGSIESFRSYDTDFEKYTLGAYENWPEEKWIDVSAPEWQACTASRVDALVQKGVDGFFVDNTDVYYNYPQESIYDGILTILDYMDHTGRKIMINGGDCFVKKYLTTEKNVLIDGVNQENVFTAYDFSKDIYTKNDQSTREYYTEYLDLAMSHGCTAYTLEYAMDPTIRRQPPTPGSMGTSAIFLIISGYVWEDNIFLSSAITEMLSHRYPDAYFSHYHYHLDTHHNNNRYCIPPSLVCPLSPRNIRPAFWLSIRSENEFHAASANPVYPKTCYISPGYTFLLIFS